MSTQANSIEALANQEYKWGFVTEIGAEQVPKGLNEEIIQSLGNLLGSYLGDETPLIFLVCKGLNEEIIRTISAKKNEPEFMLEWRLKAYRHWLTMTEPTWPNVHYPAIDYQEIVYYSAPKMKKGPKSLDEVDPELLATYDKLGIPLREREILAGVAVDAVFDSVSVATTFKAKLKEVGVIFRSFSEAV